MQPNVRRVINTLGIAVLLVVAWRLDFMYAAIMMLVGGGVWSAIRWMHRREMAQLDRSRRDDDLPSGG